MPRRSRFVWGLAFALLFGSRLFSGETPAGEALRIHPAIDGSITFFLISPALPAEAAAQTEAPRDVREGQGAPGGTWKLYQTNLPYADLSKDLSGAQRGAVWCCGRIQSKGGKRAVVAISPLAMKVFLNGKEIVNKKPASGGADEYAAADIALPEGISEVALLVGVKYGQCPFRFAFLDAKATEPVPGDLWLLPTAAAPDPGAAVGRALSVRSNSSFLDAHKGPTLSLALRGCRPDFDEPLGARILGPDGKVLPIQFTPRSAAQLQAAACQVELPLLKSARGTLDVTCEILAKDRVLDRKALRFYELEAVQKDATAFAAEVEAARKKTGTRLPMAELVVEKIELWTQQLDVGGAPSPALGQLLVELLEEGRTLLAAEEKGRDPHAQRVGYFERAYISRIDESPQPYFILVPSAAEKALKGEEKDRRFPLVLFLHGYVPDFNKHHWWTEMPEFNAVLEKNDCFLAIPFGRSNADFLGPGEVDVLDAMNEMKRLYPIDERRVYLYGYSMGGMGVYSLAGHYPDLWAGAIVLAGHAGSPLAWYTPGLDKLAPFKQHLIRTDQALDQCENFLNIPFQIFHGESDTVVKPADARTMQVRIKEVGGQAELTFLRGDHWSLFDLMATEPPLKKMLERPRPEPLARVRRKFHALSYGDASLFRVTGKTNGLDPFEVEWTRKDDGYEITRFAGPARTLGDWLVDPKQPVRWPAKELEERFAGSRNDVRAKPGQPVAQKPQGTGKTPLRCGPVKEATYGPFIVTYGTTGGEAATAKLKKRAQDFAQWWLDFAKGRVAVKADREVTEQERREKSLFLFGEEQEHALHAEAAPRLPFKVKDGKFTAGERTVELSSRGVLYIYPSPFGAPHCSLVIVAGAPYGPNLPVNHRLDLVPDFLLFESFLDDDGTKTNKPLLAGFFDGEWKLDPATTWWTEKGKPAAGP